MISERKKTKFRNSPYSSKKVEKRCLEANTINVLVGKINLIRAVTKGLYKGMLVSSFQPNFMAMKHWRFSIINSFIVGIDFVIRA